MAEELATRAREIQEAPALAVRKQVNQIQYLMQSVLQDGTHYGTVKGCGNKPTLLQPGAEKIAFMFHLVPSYDVQREQLGGGHREYTIECSLKSLDTGEVMGYGVGECSTMESKYRYRWQGQGYDRRKVENPDIADTWNTCLKMAKKRAFVDAVRSTTSASDIFTQDVEDMPEGYFDQPAPNVDPAAPAADLAPVRERFNAYKAAIDKTPQGAVDELCGITGAASMEAMTPAQAETAVEAMDEAISAHEAAQAAREAAYAGDAEAQAQAMEEQAVEAEYVTEVF